MMILTCTDAHVHIREPCRKTKDFRANLGKILDNDSESRVTDDTEYQGWTARFRTTAGAGPRPPRQGGQAPPGPACAATGRPAPDQVAYGAPGRSGIGAGGSARARQIASTAGARRPSRAPLPSLLLLPSRPTTRQSSAPQPTRVPTPCSLASRPSVASVRLSIMSSVSSAAIRPGASGGQSDAKVIAHTTRVRS